jgi:hypothetical protein
MSLYGCDSKQTPYPLSPYLYLFSIKVKGIRYRERRGETATESLLRSVG